MSGSSRQDKWRVQLDGLQVEAVRRVLYQAITGTLPTPNPHLHALDIHLTTETERLDADPERQNVHSNAYENLHAVKFGKGTLYGFTAYSSNASSQFIQVFDNSKAPATGDVPAVVFPVPATDFRAVEWIHGRPFLTGCFLANSTTGPTYTAGAADTFFDVQFI